MEPARLKQFQDMGLQTAETLLAPFPIPHLAEMAMPDLISWLVPGAIHEWFLDMPDEIGIWFPPLTVVTHMALQAIGGYESQRRLVWIGQRCWPTFQMLAAEPYGEAFLKQCIFLDPLTQAEKVWSIAEALRCAGVGVVIADGSGMDATASRRLQLAVETGIGRALIARPLQERDSASWAQTQWIVRPEASEGFRMHWDIQLVRSRGRQIRQDASCHWSLEWTYEVLRGTNTFGLSARVGHATHPARREIRAG